MQQELLGIKITTGRYLAVVEDIIALTKSGSNYVCVANVHMLIEAHLKKSYSDIINNADVVTADGMPLTWGLRLLYGGDRQPRVAGMDLLPDLLRRSEMEMIPVYFYGGSENMAEQLRIQLPQKYPQLKIAGITSPPFRALTAEEREDAANTINKSGARLVFVVLGCPKQEIWMGEMKNKVQATMIGIGGAVPVMLNMQKRAPKWMQTAGLEWLNRLASEPRRLFKRYAYTNSLFIYLMTKKYLKIKFGDGKRLTSFR